MIVNVALGLALFLVVMLAVCVRYVPKTRCYIIERHGEYFTQKTSGFCVLIPTKDKIRERVRVSNNIETISGLTVSKEDDAISLTLEVAWRVQDAKTYCYEHRWDVRQHALYIANRVMLKYSSDCLDSIMKRSIEREIRDELRAGCERMGVRIHYVLINNVDVAGKSVRGPRKRVAKTSKKQNFEHINWENDMCADGTLHHPNVLSIKERKAQLKKGIVK